VRVYTVHLRPGADPPGSDALLVKEGFCWPAFFFGIVWALWHRMWLTAIVFVLVLFAVDVIVQLFALSPPAGAALSLAAALLIGAGANDLRRRALRRRGYDAAGLVAATNEDAAVLRWLDSNPSAAARGY
jgi:hypothetical protein